MLLSALRPRLNSASPVGHHVLCVVLQALTLVLPGFQFFGPLTHQPLPMLLVEFVMSPPIRMGFPGGASGEEPNPPANAGDLRDMGSVPESGRSPGGDHSNPLQYSCLENPMDTGAWKAMISRVAKSQIGLK